MDDRDPAVDHLDIVDLHDVGRETGFVRDPRLVRTALGIATGSAAELGREPLTTTRGDSNPASADPARNRYRHPPPASDTRSVSRTSSDTIPVSMRAM